MKDKPTATYFRPHLLTALGQLSGFKADVPIARETVIKAVLEQLQMNEDALGKKHGKRETHRLIGLAFRGIRTLADPLTSSPGKNLWALTRRGVEEAAKLMSDPIPEAEPKPEQQIASLTNPYDDPYLRGLAVCQSPCSLCYGLLYDPKDSTCQSCPIASFCREAMYDAYKQAALAIQDAKPSDTDEPEPDESEEPKTEPMRLVTLTPDQISEGVLLKPKTRTFHCQMCAQKIEEPQCMFVESLGAFHLKCWPD